ncbi:MAG: glycosyltransferase [Firmicutes bacterium]|nr:glycosyltransferase [Bacillota bacterium]
MDLWARVVLWVLAIYGFWSLGAVLWERVVLSFLASEERFFLSFLLLVRNGEEYLEVWLRELTALPAQAFCTASHYEIVVVDCASGDRTPEILERLSRRIPNLKSVSLNSSQPGQGPLELGLFLCQSRLVLLLDLQDRGSPQLLANVKTLLQKRSRPFLVP